MKKNLYKLLTLSVTLALTSFMYFTGCTDKGAPSLYSDVPSGPVGATPQITSMSPDYGLAGVTKITVKGSNFSTTPSENIVYFNGQPGNVLSSTSNQLEVISPNVFGDSVKVMTARLHSELFSNTLNYTLKPAVKLFYPDTVKDAVTKPYAITTDKSGDIYASVTVSERGQGIKEITPDSVITDFAGKGLATFWKCMKFGWDGAIYTPYTASSSGKSFGAIFKNSGGSSSLFAQLPVPSNVSQLDFDPAGNMWVGGDDSFIYRVKQDKSVDKFPFDYSVTAMRVFVDGGTTYLYVAAKKDSLTKIIRMPIDGNENLGSPETYFDFSAKYGANYTVNAIDFSSDGDLYLGTDYANPIIAVHTDKSTEPLYPSLLKPAGGVYSFAFTSKYLYYTSSEKSTGSGIIDHQAIIRLDLQKSGAPYYGLQ